MSKENQIEIVVPVDVKGIDEAFVQLVLKSKLGELIEKQINEVFNNDRFSGQRAITRAVEDAVRVVVTNIAREKIKEHEQVIKEYISELITEKFLREFIGKFWDRVFKDI